MENFFEKLKSLGLEEHLGEWSQKRALDLNELKSIKNQKKSFTKVQELLQVQLEMDQKQLQDLKEKLNRLKHGGGA